MADLILSHPPCVQLCPAEFRFCFSSCYILLPFCPYLNCHLALLGPETHSLQACLSLCPSSNRVLSISIALDIRLFPLILRPLSSKLLFARLPHGNLGEPSTKDTLRSLRIVPCHHHTFQHTDCSLPAALCIFSPALGLAACCGLSKNFSINYKRALLFVLLPQLAPNYQILLPAHLFRPLLLLWFR